MTEQEYIQQHIDDDVRELALKPVPQGIDLHWCLQQIEGRQHAVKKLPRWASTPDVWYPPHLPMEQCSSQETALYKAQLVQDLLPHPSQRISMADLTGGYGVDFSYIAPHFQHAHYIELDPSLCHIAHHNMPLLGLPHAHIHNTDATHYYQSHTLTIIDPARRDLHGRKTIALADCTPNIIELQDHLRTIAPYTIIKLSPMLDICHTLNLLSGIAQIHVVSVKGECKELLLVMTRQVNATPQIICANLQTDQPVYSASTDSHPAPTLALSPAQYLYEPNASILKGGIQDTLCHTYHTDKLHSHSNLFTSHTPIPHFPGRRFCILQVCLFDKHSIRQLQSTTPQANITIRNFPGTVESLRRRLKIKEGGDKYIFATTLSQGQHVLIVCEKM